MVLKTLQDLIFILSKFNVHLRYKNKNIFKYAYKWIYLVRIDEKFVYEIEKQMKL